MRSAQRAHTALDELTAAYGVVHEYRGDGGQQLHGSTEAVLAALRALGAPVEREDDAPAALAAFRARAAEQLVEPVIVDWAGRGARVPLRPGQDGVDATLVREDGEEHRFAAGPALRLPRGLPSGYHTLHLEAADGATAEALVITAPERAPDDGRRRLGVFLPLYSLPSDGPLADFGDLSDLLRASAAHGASLVGTTPLYAAFLDDPCEPSPYAPASRLFWNDLYVDLETLPELQRAPRVPRLLERLGRLGGTGELIDYPAIAAARTDVLDELATAAFADDGPRRDALDAYVAANPRLVAYAEFRARGAADADAVRRRHVYAQWVAEAQLAEVSRTGDAVGCGLYLDLPVGVHREGFDIAADPASFARGMTAGAPPDLFQPHGQNWGLPPLHPIGIRETGHRYLIACMRQALRYARAIRIDHVAGLHRLFWVPEGLPASEGVYVRYPADELYAILLVEAERRGALVAGEDLGTVPSEVREALERHGLLRSYVLQFELEPDDAGPAPAPPADSLASLGTHDLPQFAAWWQDGTAVERAPAEARRRVAELAGSPARVVLANLEDLWGETEPQNRPGTVGGANWRRRARHGAADLDRLPDLAAGLQALAEVRA